MSHLHKKSTAHSSSFPVTAFKSAPKKRG